VVFRNSPPTHLLKDTVTIQALTQAATGVGGGHTQAWANSLVSIKARIQGFPGSFSVSQGASRNKKGYVIFIKPGQAVYAGMRATFTDFESVARTVDINSVKNNQQANVITRLDCTEVLD
jgi:hypothetical protein